MTGLPGSVETSPEDGNSVPIVAWELPEIFVIVVAVSVALLALGGLGTGIAISVTTGFLGTTQGVWNAIQFGGQWANVYLAAILLGALGLSWWQVHRWTGAANVSANERDTSADLEHIRRAQRMTGWVEAALALNAAGAIAEFIGQVGSYGSGRDLWSYDIGGGSEMLAVLVIAATGILASRRFQHRYSQLRPT